MALTCTSTENDFSVTENFTVTITDACLVTSFVWPTFDPISIDLYAPETTTIALAETAVVGCEPVTMSIDSILTTPGFVGTIPPITIDNNGGSPILTINPMDPNNVGTFTVVLEACTTLPQNGQTNCQ